MQRDFPAFPFALKTARIFLLVSLELIENVDERRYVVLCLVVDVNTVVDGDEVDVGVRKNHLRVHTDFQVVTTESAHIF